MVTWVVKPWTAPSWGLLQYPTLVIREHNAIGIGRLRLRFPGIQTLSGIIVDTAILVGVGELHDVIGTVVLGSNTALTAAVEGHARSVAVGRGLKEWLLRLQLCLWEALLLLVLFISNAYIDISGKALPWHLSQHPLCQTSIPARPYIDPGGKVPHGRKVQCHNISPRE